MKKTVKRTAAKRPTARRAKRPIKTTTPLRTIAVPALGALWPGQGGRFAGISKGAAGAPDHLLVFATLEGKHDQPGAIAAAKSHTADGHKDFDAATLAESALCFATVREHFKRDWYWTKEQRADAPGYGWIQSFYNGPQSWFPPGDRTCVFAVRRLPIR